MPSIKYDAMSTASYGLTKTKQIFNILNKQLVIKLLEVFLYD